MIVSSFQDCYQNCVEKHYTEKYQCLPNPFIYENFILINSNQTEHRICYQNLTYFEINEKNFEKICNKDCNEIYFSTRFDNSLVLYIKESKVVIKTSILWNTNTLLNKNTVLLTICQTSADYLDSGLE